MPLTPPRLWVVATPLGNIEDFSPRGRAILATADLILAEDTRRAGLLLKACGIKAKKLLSFHEHNEAERHEEALRALAEGGNIAIISDAGTPLLADPGYRLVRSCREQKIPVSPVPGSSAPITALSAAGIPPIPFSFLGFLPRGEGDRQKLFRKFVDVGTIVFFERKDRLAESMRLAALILGAREYAICRELTKTHEEFILGRLGDEIPPEKDIPGELTIIIGPPEHSAKTPKTDLLAMIRAELAKGGKAKEVASSIRKISRGWSGKEIYDLINEINSGNSD